MITLNTSIDEVGGVYQACIRLLTVSPEAGAVLRATGGLTVDLGGTITGSASRPNETATTLAFAPAGGETPTIAAQATALVNATTGALQTVTITNPGAGYTVAPTVTVVGQGISGAVTATITNGSVTGLVIGTAGTGYKNVPTGVSFTLPAREVNIINDLPVLFELALADDAQADIKVAVWLDTALTRIRAAYNSAAATSANFVASTTVRIP